MDAEFYDQLMRKRQQDAQHKRTANVGGSGNDIPLINGNEAVTGEIREGFPSADAKNPQNNHNDPFPMVPAEIKASRQRTNPPKLKED